MKIQQQIIDFLKEHDGATTTEIMNGLGITRSPVGDRLRKLIAAGVISRETEIIQGNRRIYRNHIAKPNAAAIDNSDVFASAKTLSAASQLDRLLAAARANRQGA